MRLSKVERTKRNAARAVRNQQEAEEAAAAEAKAAAALLEKKPELKILEVACYDEEVNNVFCNAFFVR
jgi:hypothetical protein